MTLQFSFDNSYARLPQRFFHKQSAAPVRAPALIAINDRLAAELGLDPGELKTEAGISYLAGNGTPEGAEPLAQAYAGHQFGGWNPQLGDGRALLIGEITDSGGQRQDIQLKGSGRTPFSRMGDGRAWVGPVLREYIVSEAMHAMGIPTTRALAAVTTGEPVVRENGPLPGAVLTRVASSHIRVGTFQYFAARGDEEAVALLTNHVIARHYPDAENALDLLNAVIENQARLIADWMSVGFIHGVMNTDNCHVAGITIDYGPCAFMDTYQADKVFSSIDVHGRYAYNQQPNIAVWNLAQFATSLLPLIDSDTEIAVQKATAAVHRFPELYRAEWLDRFRRKIGLKGADDSDETLIDGLLSAMEAGRADFTNTFQAFSRGDPRDHFGAPEALDAWRPSYSARLNAQGGADSEAMARANPAVIPRNHQIEATIQAAVAGDYAPFHALVAVTTDPFSDARADYLLPPDADQEVTRTFCGT